MAWVGLGYRPAFSDWIAASGEHIDGLELVAEHFYDKPALVDTLPERLPLAMHGLGLSLGTPGPLDQAYLAKFLDVCRRADRLWISEHLAFTRTADVDLGHLNPVAYTAQALAVFADHVAEIQDSSGKRLLIENITTQLQVAGYIPESVFMNRLCEQTGCGVLLDVTNLYINSRNHAFDASTWLRALDPGYIAQLHIIGYSHTSQGLEDRHAQSVQPELLELLGEVTRLAGPVPTTLEWDHNFPDAVELQSNLAVIRAEIDDNDFSRVSRSAAN